MTGRLAAAALAVRPAPAAPAEVGIAGELVAHVVAELPALAVLDQRGSVAGRGLAGVAALGPDPPCFATDLLNLAYVAGRTPTRTKRGGHAPAWHAPRAVSPAVQPRHPRPSGTCKIASSALFLDEISRRNSYAEYTDRSVE